MRALVIALLAVCAIPAAAESQQGRDTTISLTVTPDRADWRYRLGDTARFTVSLTRRGRPVPNVPVVVEISRERLPSHRTDTVNLSRGPRVVRATLPEPGFLRATATAMIDGVRYSRYATAAFSPERIEPTTTMPADFEMFWRTAIAEARQTPLEPVMTRMPERSTPDVDVFHVSFQNHRVGSRLYGMLSIPTRPGKYPAMLVVPGAGVRPYFPSVATARRGVIHLTIGIHGIPVDRDSLLYNELRATALQGYRWAGIEDRDAYYYKRVFVGVVRAGDFLFSLPQFDGERYVVQGGSQGGGLAIVAAALDPRVDAIASSYPAMSDHFGYLHGRTGGWPHVFADTVGMKAKEEKMETLRYYDVVNFARLLRVPGIYAWGFNDRVVPPTSVFAAYNVITAPKEAVIVPETEHYRVPAQIERMDAWLLQQLGVSPAATSQQPLPRGGMEPPRFTDPARASKLASAFGDIDRLFREFATREHVPGAAWGIIVDGRLAHVGVTGVRDIATRAPVDTNTVFRIASMTKSFTALAILKLRDEGKLSLDDPAERYVPELAGLAYPTTDSPRITIRHLLSHAEGFPEDNPWGDQQLAITEEEMSALMRTGIPFSNAPGVAYEYSNYGFAILGRIIARVSGMPYAEYVSAAILRPLDMTSTTLEPSAVPDERIARGYRWEDEQWKLEPPLPDGAFGPMGGMLTSITDLGDYVAMYLAAWPPRDGAETAPLRRASLREMQQIARPSTPTVTRGGPGEPVRLNAGGYGFGLRVSTTCALRHVVAHSGGLPGFGSQMRWLPEHGVGLIALGNRTYTGWTRPFDEALARLAETGALEPRVPQPSPALVRARDAVTRLVIRWDDRLADSVAANNLFLDRSRDRRRTEIAALRGRVGECRAGSGFDNVENALRGQWTIPCERGSLRVAITLAPIVPPRVQYLEVTPVSTPPEPRRAGQCSV